MIECLFFHETEYGTYNAKVVDRPEVNCTAGSGGMPSHVPTYEEMVQMLVDRWNELTPDQQITADDLHFTEAEPW